MTELGESTDPRVLVPGKAAGIDQAAARWRRLAGVAEQTATSLKAVGVPEGWAGDAADAFESRVASVGRRWNRVSDALTAAASALEGFSSTLLWAQGQAEVSVDMWERAARQSAEGVAAPMVGLGLRAEASPSSPVDPGGPLRQRAVELLGDARERLAAAGDSAASAIDAAAAEPDLDAEVWVALGASAGTPQEALAVLRGLDADDLASMLRVRPDLADTLSRAEAADVAAWWKGLDDSQQGALIAAIPAVVGNLNGVAYVARDRANREWLDDQLADARKALTAAEKSLPWWQIDNPELVGAHDAKLIAAREQFEALTNIDAALTGTSGGTERFLISLSADTPPLAAISIGDIDVADNITYAVPGMGTTTSEGIGAWTQAAENIERWQSQYAPDAVHAVVAWVGYETPPVPGNGGFQVLGTEHAEAGATKLSRALGGIDATRPDAHVNVRGALLRDYHVVDRVDAVGHPGRLLREPGLCRSPAKYRPRLRLECRGGVRRSGPRRGGDRPCWRRPVGMDRQALPRTSREPHRGRFRSPRLRNRWKRNRCPRDRSQSPHSHRQRIPRPWYRITGKRRVRDHRTR